jgi:hypothetical protein
MVPLVLWGVPLPLLLPHMAHGVEQLMPGLLPPLVLQLRLLLHQDKY